MRPFLSALSFLTTIPVRTDNLTAGDFARANSWFAGVGLCIGAGLVLADVGLQTILPEGIAAVLLLTLWVILTGGLHWDGFLDCCDALFASVSPTRRLEILKDVHIGAYGFIAGGLLLLAYVIALYELPDSQRGITLLVAPIAGRWLMTVAQQCFPYMRRSGLGQLVPPNRWAVVWGFVPLLLAVFGGWAFVFRMVIVLLVGYGVAWWMAQQLGGGLTGDCYGALCEITQVLVLIAGCLRI